MYRLGPQDSLHVKRTLTMYLMVYLRCESMVPTLDYHFLHGFYCSPLKIQDITAGTSNAGIQDRDLGIEMEYSCFSRRTPYLTHNIDLVAILIEIKRWDSAERSTFREERTLVNAPSHAQVPSGQFSSHGLGEAQVWYHCLASLTASS